MAWNGSPEQSLSATGVFNPNSDLAKQYAALQEDGDSRVDDEAGWREIHRDNAPKNASEYEALVNSYAAAGFDVKAIDMDGGFAHANFAIKPSDRKAAAEEPVPDEILPDSERLATAKERVKEYEDERWSGERAKKMFTPAKDPQSFLDKYKTNFAKNQETAKQSASTKP